MNIYEMYGRQAEQLQEAMEYHARTQKLLADIQSGACVPVQLVVTAEGWSVQPAGEATADAGQE